jgi:hypothetical protein
VGILAERQVKLPKQTYKADQIISELREAEVLISQGQTIPTVAKTSGISDQTY